MEDDENYLTPIEAIRVSAILEGALEKIELLSMLSSDIYPSSSTGSQSSTNLRGSGGDEDTPTSVANSLSQQKQLGKEYENLLNKRGNDLLITLEEKNEREKKLLDIHKKLKDNTKILCRNLEETPNESSNWKKIKNERNEIQKVLTKCKNELMRGVFRLFQQDTSDYSSTNDDSSDIVQTSSGVHKIRYDEFLSKIKKEQASKKFLEDIITREKSTNLEVKRLRQEVEKERQKKETEIAQKTQQVTTLMNRLRKLKKEREEENEKYVANRNAEFECQRRLEKATIRELDEEWRKLKIELEIEKKVFDETKAFLETKNSELNTQANLWSNKFEKEQEEMQTKVLTWKSKREDQIKLRERLEAEYESEMTEKNIREDQERKEKKEMEVERNNRIMESATRIKLAWKCYKDRELFESKMKHKKKGGKKKGKGKGKGKGRK